METEKPIAIVTGGAKGIGAACSRALSLRGFSVGIHYRESAGAAEQLRAELQNSFLIQANLENISEAERIYKAVQDRGGALAVLVNNAGAAFDAPLLSSAIEDFDRTININLKSTWYLIKRLSRFMAKRKYGRIINISSVIGHVGNAGQAMYGMSKAAIDNLTKTAALELAHYGILVNSVAPGFIDTDMTRSLSDELRSALLKRIPLGRVGTTEEVADAVLFLAQEGSYCTGSIFHVNGGMYGG